MTASVYNFPRAPRRPSCCAQVKWLEEEIARLRREVEYRRLQLWRDEHLFLVRVNQEVREELARLGVKLK